MFKKIKQKLKYPKLLLLCVSILCAYLLFQFDFFKEVAGLLNGKGYVSVFIAGFLFSYGFTTPFAIGFFATLAPNVNIFPAALLAGIGAALSDFLIFRFVRTSFHDEVEMIKMTRGMRKLASLFHVHVHKRIKKYILWTLAGFIIASPLPDEFGVSLVSGFTTINQTSFTLLSFGFNVFGIFVILKLSL